MMNYIKKNSKWIIFFISLVLFFFIAEDVFTKDIMVMDTKGYEFISGFSSKGVTLFMKCITYFGSVYVLVPLIVIVFMITKSRKLNIVIGSNLVIVTILNQVLKFIFQRPRPEEYRLINESGFSFPSGHSMVSMAFYGMLIYVIYRYVGNRYIRYGLMGILFILILFIGISRIYLGVHYTSDVIGGFLLSISYLIVYIKCTCNYIAPQE